MSDAALHAFSNLLTPIHLIYLMLGVIMGLVLGALPGLGGVAGLAILLPFTFTMEPVQAFATMIGLLATLTTGDTVPSILFGVPGSVASQATIMDGNPMTKKGEAGRALGASFSASLLGGVTGAIFLGFAIPLMLPVVLAFGSPEFFMLGLLGISMVAVISGQAPAKGLLAGAIGLLVSMIGADPQLSVLRWSFDNIYLFDGVSIVSVALGLFAVPEMMSTSIQGTSLTNVPIERLKGVRLGVIDTFRNWFLVIRCSSLGVVLGAIPGLGNNVADWFAYFHAKQTEKGARESFGTGDVRGVIAPECSNNAVQGGQLVPTLVFGIPAGANMALLLGAMNIQGMVPGTSMLTEHLDVTYTLVWSLALANIFGAILCLGLAGQIAKIALIRIQLIVPIVMALIVLGAYSVTSGFKEIIVLIVFSFVGWCMQQYKWPRPPLMLGFVLSPILEQNLFTSTSRFGLTWMSRPLVIALFIGVVATLIYGFWPSIRKVLLRGSRSRTSTGNAGIRQFAVSLSSLFTALVLAILIFALATSWNLPGQTRLFPMVTLIPAIALCAWQLYNDLLVNGDGGDAVPHSAMDFSMSADIPREVFRSRLLEFVIWAFAMLAACWVFGLVITLPVYVMVGLLHARASWRTIALMSGGVFALIIGVFHNVLHIIWSTPLIELPQQMLLGFVDSLFSSLL